MIKFEKVTELNKNNIVSELFYFISNNIDKSIFKLLDIKFFKYYLEINKENVFFIKKDGKILALISYVEKNISNKIKVKILKTLLIKPSVIFILIKNFFHFFKLVREPNNYLQLLHLIIDKNLENYIEKKTRDELIFKLHKQNIFEKYKGIHACYSKDNLIADLYYKKNDFKIYHKNHFFNFVKIDL